jgi:hypothetical protein
MPFSKDGDENLFDRFILANDYFRELATNLFNCCGDVFRHM